MESLSPSLIYQAVEILGENEDASEAEEAQLRALVSEEITVRRLADVIPEAFGMMVAAHLSGAENLSLPDTFSAQDESGAWLAFPLQQEPIFIVAVDIASHIIHNGPRHYLKNIADRSSVLTAVSQALNAGNSLDGTTLGSPSFFGLPASLYQTAE